MSARRFLCCHEHEWICRVLSCSDWTEHENLGSSTALRWIEGYCIGHKPVTPSNKNERWYQTKGITALTVWLWWNWKSVVFVVSSCFCFGIFAIGVFCSWDQKRPDKSRGSFFCRSASSQCQGLWPVIFDKSEGCQLPGFLFRISDPKKNTGRLTSWILI